MALDLRDVSLAGPALPEPFVKLHLEALLAKRRLLPKSTGDEGRALTAAWEPLRRKLRALGEQGGALRVAHHVLEPLAPRLGYTELRRSEEIATREGAEDGGMLFETEGARLRAWAVPAGTDLDAPARRGRAYRFSPERVAQRVLLACGERAGLLSDGLELRLLLCDPARPASHLAIRLDRAGGWRAARDVPDSFRLLLALAAPEGLRALPEILEEARLAQTGVTRKLREQARSAVLGFVQEVLDRPENRAALGDARRLAGGDDALARVLWKEGLLLVYRLLFVLKLETAADPARAFSFAATTLWRNTFSPQTALAPRAREVLDRGAVTGGFLEHGLRALFRVFQEGLASSELRVHALGGMLFGKDALPTLEGLAWGERAVARLLDQLLWTRESGGGLARVHYGALDVEDLGRVYEALLELEPGIASEAMARLRRAKLEVVVPIAQAEPYRTASSAGAAEEDDDDDAGEEDGEHEASGGPRRGAAGAKTRVVFVEEIPAGSFFLRTGLGRKASGSYYTPHAFVRFLVQENLGPLIAERSPPAEPMPAEILRLRVLDPAMGSGHFLVEACRFLGDALYEACRLCDEGARAAEEEAEEAERRGRAAEAETLRARAAELRRRVEDLPDPEDALVAYLPSRAPEGSESGHSQSFALALCRRLVAVHCLHGVDKNPLAVELAKLALWLESYSEGFPLTFLDHRLVLGDSLTGPFFEHLLSYPVSGARIEGLFVADLERRLTERLAAALAFVRDLDATVGADLADLERKRAAKARLDAELADFRLLAAAWSGGVQLGETGGDAAYEILVRTVAQRDDAQAIAASNEGLRRMIATGREGVAYDLLFPEVFHPDGSVARTGGFDAVLGNPPWDKQILERKMLLGSFDVSVLDASSHTQWEQRFEQRLTTDPAMREAWEALSGGVRGTMRVFRRFYARELAGGFSAGHKESFVYFVLRGCDLTARGGYAGMLVGGGMLSNASASPARRCFLIDNEPLIFLQFDNANRLFADLPPILEFCILVLSRRPMGRALRFGTHLRKFDDLGVLDRLREISRQELESSIARDLVIGEEFVSKSTRSLFECVQSAGMSLYEETNSAHYSADELVELGAGNGDARDSAVARGLMLHGMMAMRTARSFGQYDDHPRQKHSRWNTTIDFAISLGGGRWPSWCENSTWFRLALRRKCGSPKSNERSLIACVIPPGYACNDSIFVEQRAYRRPNHNVLVVLAVLNSFSADAKGREVISTTFGLPQMRATPGPVLADSTERFLAHAALRLTCNHAGYEPLWREQLGAAWREATSPFTWPVLAGDAARWPVRAAIDAAIAHAYGLDRAQYAHVLSSFSHRSHPQAPVHCLAAFDEFVGGGVDAFLRAHDPYFDIPLVETLPAPVIDLPEPATPEPGASPASAAGGESAPRSASTPRRGSRPDRSGQMQLLPPDDGPLFRPTRRGAPGARPTPPAAVTASVTEVAEDASVEEAAAFERIVEILRKRGVVTSKEVQEATGLDSVSVRLLLGRLVEEGRATREGRARGTRYRSRERH